jgi:hypothetical protein
MIRIDQPGEDLHRVCLADAMVQMVMVRAASPGKDQS